MIAQLSRRLPQPVVGRAHAPVSARLVPMQLFGAAALGGHGRSTPFVLAETCVTRSLGLVAKTTKTRY